MDKTIEVVLVAVVVVFAAALVMYLFATESSGFGTFIGNQTDGASCELGKAELRQQVDCEDYGCSPGHGGYVSEVSELRDKYEHCDVFGGTSRAVDEVCGC